MSSLLKHYQPSLTCVGLITHLKECLDEAVSGGEVSDEAGPVEGHVAALGAGEGHGLGEQRRDLVLEVDDQVV